MRVRIVLTVLAAVAVWASTFSVAVAAPAARPAPALIVRPRAAPQGGAVVFHGSGFPVLVRVVLLAGPAASEATRVGSLMTDRHGSFRARIRIAHDVEPGAYVGRACRERCRVQASAPFRVLAR